MSRMVASGTSMAITLPPVVLPTLSGDGPVTELTVRRHLVSPAPDPALNYCPPRCPPECPAAPGPYWSELPDRVDEVGS